MPLLYLKETKTMPHNHYYKSSAKATIKGQQTKTEVPSVCVMQRLARVSNKEKETGTPLGMSNRKGLNRTHQDGSRTKMRYPKVALQGALGSFKIQENNFPTGFQNEDVANRNNPSVM